jgi:hypothetical protein
MIDCVQVRVTRLDQEVQNLINCCNSEKEVIEVEFNDIRRDYQIFAKQFETNRMLGTQLLEGHDQQIWTLDFVLKAARIAIDAIQDQMAANYCWSDGRICKS